MIWPSPSPALIFVQCPTAHRPLSGTNENQKKLVVNRRCVLLQRLLHLAVIGRAMPLVYHQSEQHGFDWTPFTRRAPLHRCPEIVPPQSFDPSEIRRRQRWRRALWIVLSIFLITAVELILIRIDSYSAQRRPPQTGSHYCCLAQHTSFASSKCRYLSRQNI